MVDLVLEGGGARVTVDPGAGARLRSWVVDGVELLARRGDAPQEHGCYLMAPWAGRVRGNVVAAGSREHALPPTYDGWAMHGTVLDRTWEVLAADDCEVALRTSLGPAWPWPGRAHVTWRLEDGALVSRLRVEALAGASFPAVAGWHPWFRRRLDAGGDVAIEMAASAVLERGPDHLPTGRRLDPAAVAGPFDDAFLVPDGRVRLTWPGALELTASSTAAWVVVFDELPDEVCVEPQTGPPDGLSGPGVEVVTPERPLEVATTWRWRDAVRDRAEHLD